MIKWGLIILNFYRILPVLVLYLINKARIEKDLLAFLNYGNRLKRFNSHIYAFCYFLLFTPEFRNVVSLRYNGLSKILVRILFPNLIGFQICNTSEKIGSGLLIVHGFSTIINAKQIGINCKIYQQVTIGYGKGGVPTLGDNVTVYAGAIIVGNITIGENSIIGAGAVITKDVPSGSVVVGERFRIIRRSE